MTVGDETAIFDFGNQMPKDIHDTLEIVYKALEEKGYNPINQIVGYLMSGDPAYIPRLNDARNLIKRHERDEIIEELVRAYLKKIMRILGLDVGSRTVGVAVSDPMGWTAQGVEIIRINEDEKEFGLERLGEIIKDKQAKGVVLGLPKNMNNSEGPRAEASRLYAKMVQDKFNLPIDFQDERLTTVQAERMLIEEANISRKKRKQVIDKIAAEFILQNYLDANGKLTK